MRFVVLLKMVPDVVEELEVASDGVALDTEFLRLIVSERDDHALEQALILKERTGGEVVVIAPDAPEVDDVLFTAVAKGADRVIKVMGIDPAAGAPGVAAALAATLPGIDGVLPADLVMTGCQAIDDLAGMVAPSLAVMLDVPYLGLVASVEVEGDRATVRKEYSGGVLGEFSLSLPAVLGIQAAEKPPRYVPIAKVRAAMSSGGVETVESQAGETPPLAKVIEMAKPQSLDHAEMLTGDPKETAARIVGLLADRGLL